VKREILLLAVGVLLSGPALAAPAVPAFDLLHHDGGGDVPRAGLLLLGELGCVKCHAAPDERGKWVVPREAPNLSRVATGTKPGWIRAFLSEPHGDVLGTPMPDVLHELPETEKAQAARDLESFLRSGGDETVAAPEAPSSDISGVELFHRVGCVACHEPLDPPPPPVTDDPFFDPDAFEAPARELPSVPMAALGSKYADATALADFLLAPHTWRPAGRMPSLKLTEGEAAALADYLLGETGGAPPENAPGDTSRGKAIFEAQGCAQCHTHNDAVGAREVSTLEAPALAGLALDAVDGCLSDAPGAGAAAYVLTEEQRGALLEAVNFLQTANAPTPADALRAQMAALNCYACHARGGIGGPEPGRDAYFVFEGVADLGDEGRVPPHLDGVGAKLTEETLHDVLHGGEEVRPYMPLRMPDYRATHGDLLSEMILAVDTAGLEPEKDTGLEHHHRNRYGRELMGVNGLGCVTCHSLNGRDSVGPPGVDLALAPQRLRPHWFKEYLLDPAAYRPRTRMPEFFPEGKSTYTKLFEADPVKQIEAIWTYLKESDVSRLPEGMEPSGTFVLTPDARPIVHRTFLVDVGTRAIAVGYPEKVHVAYDGNTGAPALLWRGAFLSAESAWANRFTPFVAPLGEAVLGLPKGPGVAVLDEENAPWPEAGANVRFGGYTLDAAGAPTFLYSVSGMAIEDTTMPSQDGGLKRRMQFSKVAPNTCLRLAVSSRIEEDGEAYVTAEGLRVRVGLAGERVRVRAAGDARELTIALPPSEEPFELTVEMDW
jgi:mono/diheme cytochrome c family protein